MKEQEVIKRLNFHKEYARLSSNRVVISETDLETVLSMLKQNSAELAEKSAEIEKYKKLLADNLARNLNDSIKAKEKADTDLDDLDKGWKVELEKKDKMIDLMAEYISDLDIDEDICKKQSDNNCDDINREVECKECIKQYFERKLEYGR